MRLVSASDPVLPGFRILRLQDLETYRVVVQKTLGEWDIARVADGVSISGSGHGYKVRKIIEGEEPTKVLLVKGEDINIVLRTLL